MPNVRMCIETELIKIIVIINGPGLELLTPVSLSSQFVKIINTVPAFETSLSYYTGVV